MLGLNNLHNFPTQQHVDRFALLVHEHFSHGLINSLSGDDLATATLQRLYIQNKRVLVFVDSNSVPGIVPSRLHLIENWDQDMDSGDFQGNLVILEITPRKTDKSMLVSTKWLRVQVSRTRDSSMFYVIQANPNNNNIAMYEAMESHEASDNSLFKWERNFMNELRSELYPLIKTSKLSINAISTDFINYTRVVEFVLHDLMQLE